jgi:fibronectin-binding autotransporter adhesin
VQMGDTLVLGTSAQDLIQFMRNPIPGAPDQTRVRLNTLVSDFTTTGKTLTFAGASNDYVTMANVLFPGEIYGEDGDDSISGAMGNDFLVGGLGNDQINASGGDNIVWGDNAPSSSDATPQISVIGGNDVLSALDGNDVFYGGGGQDYVSPGAGNDYIHGGEGNDLLDGHLGDDRIYGGGGDDVISGSAGNDLLVGGAGNDLLMGRDGNDVLIGGDGGDSLTGENGSDLLVSGMVSNEASAWTSVANTTTFDPGIYVRPADNDAALMLLLTQWANSSNKSALGTVIGDGDPDSVVFGPGDDQTFGST